MPLGTEFRPHGESLWGFSYHMSKIRWEDMVRLVILKSKTFLNLKTALHSVIRYMRCVLIENPSLLWYYFFTTYFATSSGLQPQWSIAHWIPLCNSNSNHTKAESLASIWCWNNSNLPMNISMSFGISTDGFPIIYSPSSR